MSGVKVYVKIHQAGSDTILAACDEGLLGKRLEEGMLRLEVSRLFYGGFKVDLDELADYMDKATIMNLVGEHTVAKAVEEGYVHPDAVMRISGIPHAQVVSVKW